VTKPMKYFCWGVSRPTGRLEPGCHKGHEEKDLPTVGGRPSKELVQCSVCVSVTAVLSTAGIVQHDTVTSRFWGRDMAARSTPRPRTHALSSSQSSVHTRANDYPVAKALFC